MRHNMQLIMKQMRTLAGKGLAGDVAAGPSASADLGGPSENGINLSNSAPKVPAHVCAHACAYMYACPVCQPYAAIIQPAELPYA